MDYLLARIDTRKKSNIRLVISDVTTYQNVRIDGTKEYKDDYKLQDGEWFVIDNFRGKPYFKTWLNDPFNAAEYSQIQIGEYSRLRFLCAVQDDNKYMYQRLFSGNIYENKTFLSFPINGQPKIRDDSQIIIVNNEPDAIYNLSEDKLYFKSIPAIKPIFPGIEELYKEATDDEVDTFLNLDLIQAANNFTKDNVKTPNRRNIKEAQEIYNGYTEDEKSQLKTYINKYRPGLNYNGNANAFEIANDDDLKSFIYCILQRYYTTEIGGKKRVAHSIDEI